MLQELLEDSTGSIYFLQFHIQEGLDQRLLLLWMDINAYVNETSNLASRIGLATKIYEKYLDESSPHCVELDQELRDSIREEDLKSPSIHLFDHVRGWVLELLFANYFVTFLSHPLYRQYLETKGDGSFEEIDLDNLSLTEDDFINLDTSSNSLLGHFEEITAEFFKETFQLPEAELVAYCSCSIWNKNQMRKGGMYIAVSHICFFSLPSEPSNSPIQLKLPFDQITSINIANSEPQLGLIPASIMIPNSIHIVINGNEEYFTYFTSLQETYDLLTQLWVITVDNIFRSLSESNKVPKKEFSSIHRERTLGEWLTKLSVKDALATKKKNEVYHTTFRVPLEEVIVQGTLKAYSL